MPTSAAEQRIVGKFPRHRQKKQPDQGESHSDCERIRLGTMIRVEANERLQQRRGQLECQCDEPHLGKGEVKRLFENRINRRDY